MEVLQVPDEIRAEIEAGEAARADLHKEECIVLADNWPAIEVFLKFQTQWRFSYTGISGLDYTPLLDYLQRKFRKNWELMFDDVQAIERGALITYNELASK